MEHTSEEKANTEDECEINLNMYSSKCYSLVKALYIKATVTAAH